MTIYLGTASAVGDHVELPPPSGFNTLHALRITNTLATYATVFNVTADSQSAQYLVGKQQMVYRTDNIGSAQIRLQPSGATTVAQLAAGLLVEWATDPANEFQGTYPVQVT